MNKKRIIVFSISFLLIIPIITAELDVGHDDQTLPSVRIGGNPLGEVDPIFTDFWDNGSVSGGGSGTGVGNTTEEIFGAVNNGTWLYNEFWTNQTLNNWNYITNLLNWYSTGFVNATIGDFTYGILDALDMTGGNIDNVHTITSGEGTMQALTLAGTGGMNYIVDSDDDEASGGRHSWYVDSLVEADRMMYLLELGNLWLKYNFDLGGYVNATRLFIDGDANITENVSIGNYFYFDVLNQFLGIGTSEPKDNLHIIGAMDLEHISTHADDHALEIDVDAAGYGDVKAIEIEYITGDLVLGEDDGIVLINVDETHATGGDVFGFEMLATEGFAEISALKTGILINPIHQDSGVFSDMDSASNNGANSLAAFISLGTNVTLFANDNDYVIIGNTVKFEELEFILDVKSSKTIAPTFEYSDGVGSWAFFTPVDGTDGLENTGVIAWEETDIPAWVQSGGEYLIRITRTRNNVNTPPIESKVQIAVVIEYTWGKSGRLDVRSIFAADYINSTFYGSGTGLWGVWNTTAQFLDTSFFTNGSLFKFNTTNQFLSTAWLNGSLGGGADGFVPYDQGLNTTEGVNFVYVNATGLNISGTTPHLIFTDTINNRVGIGKVPAIAPLDVAGAVASYTYFRAILGVDSTYYDTQNINSYYPSAFQIIGRNGLRLRTTVNNDISIEPDGTGDTIINEAGTDSDTRIESDNDPNMCFIDGGNDVFSISNDFNVSSVGNADTTGNLTVGGISGLNLTSAVGGNITFNNGGGLWCCGPNDAGTWGCGAGSC